MADSDVNLSELLPVKEADASEKMPGLTVADIFDANRWDFIDINFNDKSGFGEYQKNISVEYNNKYSYKKGDSYSFSATREIHNPKATPSEVYSTYNAYNSKRHGMQLEVYGGDKLKEIWKTQFEQANKDNLSKGMDIPQAQLEAGRSATDTICGWAKNLVTDDSTLLASSLNAGKLGQATGDDKSGNKYNRYMMNSGAVLKVLKDPINPDQKYKEKFFQASHVTRVHQSEKPGEAIRHDLEMVNHNLNMSGVINSLYTGMRSKMLATLHAEYFEGGLSLKTEQGTKIEHSVAPGSSTIPFPTPPAQNIEYARTTFELYSNYSYAEKDFEKSNAFFHFRVVSPGIRVAREEAKHDIEKVYSKLTYAKRVFFQKPEWLTKKEMYAIQHKVFKREGRQQIQRFRRGRILARLNRIQDRFPLALERVPKF